MLSDQGLGGISQYCTYLTRISLHNCPSITDEGLIALGAFCQQLSVIELVENNLVSSEGIEGLSRALALTHVVVRECKRVSDRALSYLSRHPIKYLDFSDNTAVTDGGLRLIGLGQGPGAVARMALQTLILANLFRISDTGLRAISRGCPALEVLDVSGCDRVSDSSFSLTLSSLPTLHTLSASRESVDTG